MTSRKTPRQQRQQWLITSYSLMTLLIFSLLFAVFHLMRQVNDLEAALQEADYQEQLLINANKSLQEELDTLLRTN